MALRVELARDPDLLEVARAILLLGALPHLHVALAAIAATGNEHALAGRHEPAERHVAVARDDEAVGRHADYGVRSLAPLASLDGVVAALRLGFAAKRKVRERVKVGGAFEVDRAAVAAGAARGARADKGHSAVAARARLDDNLGRGV